VEILLLIIAIAAVVLLLMRPTSRTEVIYVPLPLSNEQGSGLGCLPLIVIGVLALLMLLTMQR
jgi:hypothetical protein